MLKPSSKLGCRMPQNYLGHHLVRVGDGRLAAVLFARIGKKTGERDIRLVQLRQ